MTVNRRVTMKFITNRVIVNIRGTNGSGKSSIPLSMLDDPEQFIVKKPYKGKQIKILTVFPTYNWVALGAYEKGKTCGGMDTLPNNELTQKAFWYALRKYPEYNLLMEGIIASTIYSTYAKLFAETQTKYPDTKVVVLHLTPGLHTCLKRIQHRNGGKPIKENLVADKIKVINRAVDKFEPEVKVIKWNNTGSMKKYRHQKLIYQVEEIIEDNIIPF